MGRMLSQEDCSCISSHCFLESVQCENPHFDRYEHNPFQTIETNNVDFMELNSIVATHIESFSTRITEVQIVGLFMEDAEKRCLVFAAFICIVVIRYSRQHLVPKSGEEEGEGGGEKEQEQKPEEQHAVVVAEAEGSQ